MTQLHKLKASVQELAGRRANEVRAEPLPDIVEEPPPVSLPSLKVLKWLGDGHVPLVREAPGWASPIAWGLLIALPPVALLFWLSAKDAATSFFLLPR